MTLLQLAGSTDIGFSQMILPPLQGLNYFGRSTQGVALGYYLSALQAF
jgi:hypothetical protein